MCPTYTLLKLSICQPICDTLLLRAAAAETVGTWMRGFGFQAMPEEQLSAMRCELRLLLFPGTHMLFKPLAQLPLHPLPLPPPPPLLQAPEPPLPACEQPPPLPALLMPAVKVLKLPEQHGGMEQEQVHASSFEALSAPVEC